MASKSKPSEWLALGSLALGCVFAFGFWWMFPSQKWWVYPLFAVFCGGLAYVCLPRK